MGYRKSPRILPPAPATSIEIWRRPPLQCRASTGATWRLPASAMRCSMTAWRLCLLPWPLIEQRLEQQIAVTVREGDRDAGGTVSQQTLSGPEALHPPYSVRAAGYSSNNGLASQSGPQACNDPSSVLRRRQSERPSIFATELGGTLVADFMRRFSDTVAGGD